MSILDMKCYLPSLLLLDLVSGVWKFDAKNNYFFSENLRILNATRVEQITKKTEKDIRDHQRFLKLNQHDSFNVPIILELRNGSFVVLESGTVCDESECSVIENFAFQNLLVYFEQFIDDFWSSQVIWSQFIHLVETIAILVLILKGVRWWTNHQLKR